VDGPPVILARFKGIDLVMASEASAAGDTHQPIGRANVDLEQELAAAHRREAATAEVLKAISRSTFNLQDVLDSLIKSAVQLTGAETGLIIRQDGEAYRPAAIYGASPEFIESAKQNPIPQGRQSATGRAVLERRIVHIHDVFDDPEYTWVGQQTAGVRTILAVPMLKEDTVIGVIGCGRREVRPFTAKQIEFVQTFADQAVIAIENARLFEAEQRQKRELQEALDYQTATSEVLRVISSSPNALQPVLDTILETAQRLCHSERAQFFVLDNGKYRLAAHKGTTPEFLQFILENPISSEIGTPSPTGKAARERRTIHVPDVAADPEIARWNLETGAKAKSILAVPLIRGGVAIGVITLSQMSVRPYTARQIELVSTFASQAVIAINNVDLFDEVQARTRELTDALEQQVATSEVLRVISNSPTNVQPVLDAIVRTAATLCASYDAVILLREEKELRITAHHGPMTLDFERLPIGRDIVAGRAVVERVPVHVRDLAAESEEFPVGHTIAVRLNQRTVLGLPLLRKAEAIGCLFLRRAEVLPFTEKEIELLRSFADQAVIAIENARLFNELREALQQQTASADVLKVISRSAFNLQAVLDTLATSAARLCEADQAVIRRRVGDDYPVVATYGLSPQQQERHKRSPMKPSRGSAYGRAIIEGRTIHIPDVATDAEFHNAASASDSGIRAAVAVPLLREGTIIGVLTVRRAEPRAYTQKQIELLETFADQAVIAIENTRLFNEIVQKSRELEIASRHKSQFVANMSHELRTPLAAMLGYAELLSDGMFGELPEKVIGIIERVQANGKHLLGLINTVLDISKIESGQFQLSLVEYSLASMIETVRVATESLAAAKKLAFRTDVVKGLPYGHGDEPRLTQVLLNLVGNAIKFTDAGEVCISAAAKNGSFVVSVSDTGPGIPDEERERIFDKFHQVDSTSTKTKGGTGLGLAIAKEIIEMHGGHIWVESIVGRGSTFRMELPVRVQAAGAAA
jgi:signal transduction histidine kinase